MISNFKSKLSSNIRLKIITVIMLITSMTVIISGMLFYTSQVNLYNKRVVEKLEVLAKVISNNTGAAILFNDKQALKENIDSFSLFKEIVSANILDASNNILIKYRNKSIDTSKLNNFNYSVPIILTDYMYYKEPIIINSELVGVLMIKTSLEELNAQITRLNFVVFTVLVFILFMNYLVMLKLKNIIKIPVTELKKLNKTITDEKNKFLNIFNKSTDGVLILTNGHFTECNESILKMLNYKTKDEILTLSPSQLSPEFQPDDTLSKEKSDIFINEAIANGSKNFEWTHIRSDGSDFIVDIMLTDISANDTDEIIHVVWRDVSKRKELENRLVEIHKSLEQRVKTEVLKNREKDNLMLQQNRLAIMGEMLSMIAHQWRQPLSSISSICTAMDIKANLDTLDNKSAIELSRKIVENTNYLSSTIDDFRNFFKTDKTKTTTTCNKLTTNALSIVESIIRNKSIKLVVKLNSSLPINIYENEVKHVLLNLIKNAEDVLIEREIQNPVITI